MIEESGLNEAVLEARQAILSHGQNYEMKRQAVHQIIKASEKQGFIHAIYKLKNSMSPSHNEAAKMLETFL